MQIKDFKAKLLAFSLVAVLFALIWLYTREFPVFTNTIGVRWLALGAGLTGGLLAGAVLYRLRVRFSPLERHFPEIVTIVVLSMAFAPLFASLLNRAGGAIEYQSFEFVSEMPYLASAYGLVKDEPIRPSGYRLIVREQGRQYLFQYKKQEYFPITEPGERILLPMRQGLLGFRVLTLK